MVNELEDFIDFLKAKHSKHSSDLNQQANLVEEPQSLYGAAKGLLIIPEDFNEPLDFN